MDSKSPTKPSKRTSKGRKIPTTTVLQPISNQTRIRIPKKKRNIPKWKLEAPKDGKTTMTRNNKTYHWCPNHKMWCVHKPSECNLTNKDNEKKSQYELRVAKALTAVIEDEEEN